MKKTKLPAGLSYSKLEIQVISTGKSKLLINESPTDVKACRFKDISQILIVLKSTPD